jgi:hypothetical protein
MSSSKKLTCTVKGLSGRPEPRTLPPLHMYACKQYIYNILIHTQKKERGES